MTPLSRKTIQHFTHSHSLREVSADSEFLCGGCKTLGSSFRYGCELCDFDLHDHCGTCPIELSSFLHEHGLKLVIRKPKATRQNDRFCDLCGDLVEGLFYRCSICDFDVHPLCTQLPEDVRHAMHPYHPLRLQRSVPGRCMVCNDTCKSWHYRCGLCSFDLHLECVLSPCKGAMPATSTARSLPMPPPSPVFSHCYGYDYGANPFPPPPNSAYAYGFPVAPRYFGPYDHDGYGILSSSFQTNFHCQHGNSSQGQGGAGKVRKKMHAIAGKLALGVLSNVVFGT
ncbi:Pyrroline-5-carboxylate synthetase isoform 1 [Hibiscus syriacus]|uniref:Pyrroline-5-carboxylate synthetase isoform 1 n=1 Tax=Hibiscus syriacus TaxID=106335 RepID=A0A6A2XWK2_HIBSY|nr:diacylglycerol kinase theta-like [Hibiscus syriacus]KAE8662759.1 Pyrroline-5-carboxylate synthetase isoform 1 [Hibiscus syriacus]